MSLTELPDDRGDAEAQLKTIGTWLYGAVIWWVAGLFATAVLPLLGLRVPGLNFGFATIVLIAWIVYRRRPLLTSPSQAPSKPLEIWVGGAVIWVGSLIGTFFVLSLLVGVLFGVSGLPAASLVVPPLVASVVVALWVRRKRRTPPLA